MTKAFLVLMTLFNLQAKDVDHVHFNHIEAYGLSLSQLESVPSFCNSTMNRKYF